MSNISDPIISISSGKKDAALGIIRISLGNKKIKKIINNLFNKKYFFPRLATFCRIIDNLKILDDVIVIYYPSPNSYNGEDIYEINSHGKKKKMLNILNFFLHKLKNYGIRVSERGEFTKRAYLNYKMDFFDVKNIYKNYYGKNIDYIKIKKIFISFLDEIFFLKMKICNYLEFNYYKSFNIKKNYLKILFFIKKFKKNLKEIFYFKNNIKISIIGKTNVGKSSLFNIILDKKRSIVDKNSGTTINYLSEKFFNSYIIDTAGINFKHKKTEKKGIKNTIKIIKNSDYLVIFLNKLKCYKKIKKILKKKKLIYVINKIDIINRKIFNKRIFFISCKKNLGIKLILKKIKKISFYEKKNKYFFYFKKNIKYIIKNTKKIYNEKDLDKIILILDKIYNKTCKLFYIKKKKIINEIFNHFCIGK
ncbi:GTPase [Candidatus Vidania fulgoroideorum]